LKAGGELSPPPGRSNGLPAAATTAAATPAASATIVAVTVAPPTAAAAAAEATTTTTTTASRSALASLADADGTPLELAAVQGLDDLVGFIIGAHLDEGEAARPAGVPVEHNLHLGHVLAPFGEDIAQLCFGSVVRQIAYIQPISHFVLLLLLGAVAGRFQ
jgi:hypothetical protein